MRYGLSLLVMLVWALWLGGLMTLFLSVTRLFANDRAIAVAAAPQLFNAFEHYQIILAAVALLSAAVWRLSEPRELLTILFFLFALASVGCVISSAMITPKMQAIRLAGQSSGPQFRALHGQSMAIYTVDAALLLIAGFVLAAVMVSRPRFSSSETDPAPGSASAPPGGPAGPAQSL